MQVKTWQFSCPYLLQRFCTFFLYTEVLLFRAEVPSWFKHLLVAWTTARPARLLTSTPRMVTLRWRHKTLSEPVYDFSVPWPPCRECWRPGKTAVAHGGWRAVFVPASSTDGSRWSQFSRTRSVLAMLTSSARRAAVFSRHCYKAGLAILGINHCKRCKWSYIKWKRVSCLHACYR